MSDDLLVLRIAMMPAAGNFLGGLVAEMFRVSARTLSRALHAAAGIVIAVVGIELMPRSAGNRVTLDPGSGFRRGRVLCSRCGSDDSSYPPPVRCH